MFTLGTMLFNSSAVCFAETESITEESVALTSMDVCIDGRFILYGCGDFQKKKDEVTELFGAYVTGGTWKKTQKGWWYQLSDGTYPRNGCIIIRDTQNYPGKSFAAITSWDQFTQHNNNPTENVKYKVEVRLDGLSYIREANTYKWSAGSRFTDTIYAFDKNGYLITSRYVNGHWFDKNGRMRIETGKYGKWIKSGKGWWYQTEDGSYLADGLFSIYSNGLAVRNGNKNLYCFDENGYLLQNAFYMDSDATFTWNNQTTYGLYYWIDKNGLCDNDITYGWFRNQAGRWFGQLPDGWYARNTWYRIDGAWYYFNRYGYAVTGTQVIGNKTYVFDENGVLQ